MARRRYSSYKKYDRAMRNFSRGMDKAARTLDSSFKSSSRKSSYRSSSYSFSGSDLGSYSSNYSPNPEIGVKTIGVSLIIVAVMASVVGLLFGGIFGFDTFLAHMPLVIAGFLGFFGIVLIICGSSDGNDSSSTKSKFYPENKEDILKLGRVAQSHTNSTCRAILNSYVAYLQTRNNIADAEEELRIARIKADGSRNQKKLERYNSAVNNLNELKEKELKARSEMCNVRTEAFDVLSKAIFQLKSSSKVWVRGHNTKVEAQITWRKCNYLKTDFDVMMIDSIFGQYYFYPNLIVRRGQSITDIDVVDWKGIKIDYVENEYLERNETPDDAMVIRQVWEHQNMDGTPNRRYKENALLYYVKYGRITIGDEFPTIIVSNLNAARQLKEALIKYTSSL